jgi:hypothetical protein
MFYNNLGHNKAMREFLLTPEGHRLLSTGRKVAFEYAQDRLHQLYPDLDIPPFTFNKTLSLQRRCRRSLLKANMMLM